MVQARARGSDNGYGGQDLATGLLTIVRGNGGSGAAPDGTECVAIESDDHEMLDPDGHATARFGRGDWISGPARLSADRQRAAFGYEDEGPGVQDLLNISDRSGRVLARFSGLDEWDWAPDGGLYATGGDANCRIDPGFGAAVVVRRFPGDRPTSVAVSTDGTRLAFSLGDRDARRNHVWVMHTDGSGLRQLTTSAANEDDPAWSPDGRQVAVRQNLVYGSVAARIPAFGYLLRPQLSPDGRTITASGWLDNGPSGMAVQRFQRNGACTGRLPQGWETSAWRPDGRLLLAVRERLGLADASQGTLAPLVRLTDPVRDLAVSPDVQRIAFTMAGHVWLIGTDGTGLRQLTTSDSSASTSGWSPDSRFVVVRPAGACGVAVVPADGERVVVGNTSVATSAWTLRAVEDGRSRNVCAFSQPHWRR